MLPPLYMINLDRRPEGAEVFRLEDARGDRAEQKVGPITDQRCDTDEDQAPGKCRA